MDIFVRLYKNYDIDLISLSAAGYDLSRMLYVSLLSFASGSPCKIMLNRDIDMGLEDIQNLRIRCRIQKDCEHVKDLLSGIKPKQRSAFCKALLRNTLSCGNLRMFLNTGDYDSAIIKGRSLIAVTDSSCIISIDDFRKGNECGMPKLTPPTPIMTPQISEVRKKPKETFTAIPSLSSKSEIKNDKQTHKDYNEHVDVSTDNTITGLLDEFPGLFG